MFPKYPSKIGSECLLFRYNENVVNVPPHTMSKAGTRIGHRLRGPMDKLWTWITSYAWLIETPSASIALLGQTKLIPTGWLDYPPSYDLCIR
jgi:hypothetical protein